MRGGRANPDALHRAISYRSGATVDVTDPSITPEQRYAAIAEELLGDSPLDATRSRAFGSSTLKIDNRIFAMLVKDELVVKLPRQRIDALIASGDGARFDPGHGRLMKEWLTVGTASGAAWLPLAREALEFVASKR